MKQQGKDNFLIDLVTGLTPMTVVSLIIAATATVVTMKALLDRNSQKVSDLSQDQIVLIKKLESIDSRLSRLEGKLDMLINAKR